MTATGSKAEANKEEATFLVLTELVFGRVHHELDRSARRPARQPDQAGARRRESCLSSREERHRTGTVEKLTVCSFEVFSPTGKNRLGRS